MSTIFSRVFCHFCKLCFILALLVLFVFFVIDTENDIPRVSSYPYWDFLDSLATWYRSSSSPRQRWQQTSSTGNKCNKHIHPNVLFWKMLKQSFADFWSLWRSSTQPSSSSSSLTSPLCEVSNIITNSLRNLLSLSLPSPYPEQEKMRSRNACHFLLSLFYQQLANK